METGGLDECLHRRRLFLDLRVDPDEPEQNCEDGLWKTRSPEQPQLCVV